MPRLLTTLFPVLLLSGSLSASHYNLHGTVTDSETGERMIGIYLTETLSGERTITDNYGNYSLLLQEDTVALCLGYFGQNTCIAPFWLAKDSMVNWSFSFQIPLNEVQITTSGTLQNNSEPGTLKAPLPIINALPVLLGETDLVKTLQFMPGILCGSEGSSDLLVRGGNPDQNLILLDDVPLYNVSHLGGYFSAFNTDAIKEASLLKGGLAARYSGRLSSVLDVRLKDGNRKQWGGQASVGTLSSRLLLEGPIRKDRGAILLAARRSYYDLLAAPFIKRSTGLKTGLYFYDLNGKLNYDLNQNNTLYFNFYQGRDKFFLKDKQSSNAQDLRLHYGNTLYTIKLVSLLGSASVNNFNLSYSKYHFTTSEEYGNPDHYDALRSYRSGISSIMAKNIFNTRIAPWYTIYAGCIGQYHTFNPGVTRQAIPSEAIERHEGGSKLYAWELAVFTENQLHLGNWKGQAGINLALYPINNLLYVYPEPRLSLTWQTTPRINFHGTYDHTSQVLNLLSNSSLGLPTDLWVPANGSLKPQHSKQAALGLGAELNYFKWTTDFFYKTMTGLTEYREGVSYLLLNAAWQEQITSGNGRAYGMECLLEKTKGKTRGWLSYTYSRNYRSFNDLNAGQEFRHKYDRPHALSLVVVRNMSATWSISADWTYYSGTNITLPGSNYADYLSIDPRNTAFDFQYYWYQSAYTGEYTGRNNFRLPAYHRLDMGTSFTAKKANYTRTWSLGLYNAYNQKNAFTYYLWYDDALKRPVLYKLTLFPIMPYFRYAITF